MAVFKCKMCGGALEVNNETVAVCEYCGTKQTVPISRDEVVSNLFNRANNLRLKCEFDKAEQVYEKILDIDNTDSEAHWGIVLCKYGIEYVEDTKTYSRIPTCHRTLYEAVLADVNYLSAIENADEEQKELYVAEAEIINELQKNILNIVNNEEPFDVFLCYKETDENGKRTVDSAITNDIYYQLTQEGFKVFYAPITLEDKLGYEFEPYIFAALNSAKVMLVVGTKPEYFDSVWVRNEWSRYLKLTKNDRSKLLIPCYRDMDAYELPDEFAHLQAQDMGKIGFISDVIRGIKKVLQTSGESIIQNNLSFESTEKTQEMLNKNDMDKLTFFMEEGKWNKAKKLCNKLLETDYKNSELYLIKLMIKCRTIKREGIVLLNHPLSKNKAFGSALRYGDRALTQELLKYEELQKYKKEAFRMTGQKAFAWAMLGLSLVLLIAYLLFPEISLLDTISYETWDALSSLPDYSLVTALFLSLIFVLLLMFVPKRRKTLYKEFYKEKSDLPFNERVDALKEISLKKKKKKDRIIGALLKYILPIFILVQITLIVLELVVIPYSKYKSAMAKIEEGNLSSGYADLISLENYKRAQEQLKNISFDSKIEIIKNAEVGDTVYLGTYEQDGNKANGAEVMQWQVLERQEDKVLVINKYVIEEMSYETYNETAIDWETSDVRSWLNKDFLEQAFSDRESTMIPEVELLNYADYDIPINDMFSEHYMNDDKMLREQGVVGENTIDKVFLLSSDEVEKYLPGDKCRARSSKSIRGWYYYDYYLLRTSITKQSDLFGDYATMFASVSMFGEIEFQHSSGIRPAMWIDVSEVE